MQFNPCMKHKLIRNSVRHFAEKELAPIAAEIDRNATFPVDVIGKMKALNYFGLQVSKEFGGAAMDSISAAIVMEEISRVCAAVGLCVAVHNGVAVYPFLQFATPEQKKHYLPKLASGEIIGAFSLTEANAGSDSASVETTAVKKNQEYILNGTKIFVTNGGVCDLALIFALTGSDPTRLQSSVFIVESGFPGFLRGELEDLCGMRANPVSSLFLEDCCVPAKNLAEKGDERDKEVYETMEDWGLLKEDKGFKKSTGILNYLNLLKNRIARKDVENRFASELDKIIYSLEKNFNVRGLK